MGGIADEHVEWAIVNRLKAMLDEPPQTTFNVTQTFALFSSVLVDSTAKCNGSSKADFDVPAKF